MRLVGRLCHDKSAVESVLEDTRPTHGEILADVTPPELPHLAGNYRGENLPYLCECDVVLQDQFGQIVHQGTPYVHVAAHMAEFHSQLKTQFQLFLDHAVKSSLSPVDQLIGFSKLVGVFFACFVSIHPYANGNGHASRFLIWCIFNKYSVNCAFWEVSKRNPDPADELIAKFQRKDYEPLIECFLNLIKAENDSILEGKAA